MCICNVSIILMKSSHTPRNAIRIIQSHKSFDVRSLQLRCSCLMLIIAAYNCSKINQMEFVIQAHFTDAYHSFLRRLPPPNLLMAKIKFRGSLSLLTSAYCAYVANMLQRTRHRPTAWHCSQNLISNVCMCVCTKPLL